MPTHRSAATLRGVLNGPSAPARVWGRNAEIARALEMLRGSDHQPRQIEIVGPPGSGKSALAAILAQRALKSADRVIWVDGADTSPARLTLSALAALRGVHPGVTDVDPLLSGLAACVELGPFAYVIDNAHLLPATHPLLHPHGAQLVIRTQAEPSPTDIPSVRLSSLTRKATDDWLTRTVPHLEPRSSRIIAARIDRLPITIEQVIGELRIRATAHDALSIEKLLDSATNTAGFELGSSVARRLKTVNTSPLLAKLLGAFGLEQASRHSVALLWSSQLNRSNREFTEAESTLARLGLIRLERGALKSHSSVLAALRQVVPLRGAELDDAVNGLENLIVSRVGKYEPDVLALAHGICMNADPTRAGVRHLSEAVVGTTMSRAMYQEAAALAERTLQSGDIQALNPASVVLYAEALHSAGSHALAMQTVESMHLTDHDHVDLLVRSLRLKSSIAFSENDFVDAKRYAEKAIQTAPEGGVEVPLEVDLARALRSMGDSAKAARRLMRARRFAASPADELRLLVYLLLCIADSGHPELSTPIIARANELESKAGARAPWLMALMQANSGYCLMKAKAYDESLTAMSSALRKFARWQGRQHFDVGIMANNVARVLRSSGRAEEAIKFHRWALDTTQGNLVQEAFARIEFGATLVNCERWSEAVTELGAAENALRRAQVHPGHPYWQRCLEVKGTLPRPSVLGSG